MVKGSKRAKNRVNECSRCKSKFNCSDPKASICEECKKCRYCGTYIKRPKLDGYCKKCRFKHVRTDKQKSQLERLHNGMFGDGNPSKRPEVRRKLSEAKMGILNPAYKDLPRWREHISKYRPGKISLLEKSISPLLSEFTPQFRFKWYAIDFADEQNKIAIEVQGCWHHSCQLCFPGSPTSPTQKRSHGNDLRKKNILEKHGWKILYIFEHEIRNRNNDELSQYIRDAILLK